MFVQYIGEKEGGMNKLKGKKIALVYHNSAYGKEPIRTLESAAAKIYGFEFMAVACRPSLVKSKRQPGYKSAKSVPTGS